MLFKHLREWIDNRGVTSASQHRNLLLKGSICRFLKRGLSVVSPDGRGYIIADDFGGVPVRNRVIGCW